jgi:transcriptional regulator with XRE-family HTH domain
MKSSKNNSDQEPIYIGEQLKNLRIERDLTIREMATICGLAVNTLSLIENGKSIPTVNTLQNIANSLRIPITSFFETSQNTHTVDSVKNLNRLEQPTPYGSILALFSDESFATFIEPYVIKVFPFSTWGTDQTTQSGYKFVLCLSGTVVYSISNNIYILNEGDSILFCLNEPHIWKNPTSSTSTILFILFPPEIQERKIRKYI